MKKQVKIKPGQIIRQGDIFLLAVPRDVLNLEDASKKVDNIIEEGETLGHTHRLLDEDVAAGKATVYTDESGMAKRLLRDHGVFLPVNGLAEALFIDVADDVQVVHEDHNPGLLPGDLAYIYFGQYEFDPAERMRRAVD